MSTTMNTTSERLVRIDTQRSEADPTLPRRLSAAELEEHMRQQREEHDQAVEDALSLFRARQHRRASDNDSRIPGADRARAVTRRAQYRERQQRMDLAWWACIIVLGGYVVAVSAYHLGRYGW
jgi:hypothetical protein